MSKAATLKLNAITERRHKLIISMLWDMFMQFNLEHEADLQDRSLELLTEYRRYRMSESEAMSAMAGLLDQYREREVR